MATALLQLLLFSLVGGCGHEWTPERARSNSWFAEVTSFWVSRAPGVETRALEAANSLSRQFPRLPTGVLALVEIIRGLRLGEELGLESKMAHSQRFPTYSRYVTRLRC